MSAPAPPPSGGMAWPPGTAPQQLSAGQGRAELEEGCGVSIAEFLSSMHVMRRGFPSTMSVQAEKRLRYADYAQFAQPGAHGFPAQPGHWHHAPHALGYQHAYAVDHKLPQEGEVLGSFSAGREHKSSSDRFQANLNRGMPSRSTSFRKVASECESYVSADVDPISRPLGFREVVVRSGGLWRTRCRFFLCFAGVIGTAGAVIALAA